MKDPTLKEYRVRAIEKRREDIQLVVPKKMQKKVMTASS